MHVLKTFICDVTILEQESCKTKLFRARKKAQKISNKIIFNRDVIYLKKINSDVFLSFKNEKKILFIFLIVREVKFNRRRKKIN